jgi:hypothetical protein
MFHTYMIVWYLDLQLPMYLVPITTCVMSSNTTHGEVIKFVSDLRKVGRSVYHIEVK